MYIEDKSLLFVIEVTDFSPSLSFVFFTLLMFCFLPSIMFFGAFLFLIFVQ